MYKIETHLHTPYVSNCARMPADEIVRFYKAAGYSAITVTDHYSFDNFGWKGIDIYDSAYDPASFYEGFLQVRDAAEREGMRVYLGAELRFAGSMNDYLIYGFSPSFLEETKKICSMSLVEFAPIARAQGILLIQAHPFRNLCVPSNPDLLDGIEVINRNPNHKNHNDMAFAYAKQNGLLGIGGSDFHGDAVQTLGGIATNILPNDSAALAQLLRSGEFTIL